MLLNPLAAPPEIVHQLDDANVGAVFTVASLAPHLPRGALGLLGAGLAAAPVAAGYVLLAFTGPERRQLWAGVRRRRRR